MYECEICGAVITLGAHDPDCGNIARTRLAKAQRYIKELEAELGRPTEMIDFPYHFDGDQ